MKHMMLIVGALFGVAALGGLGFLARRKGRDRWIACANVVAATPHDKGNISRTLLSALSVPHLLVKVGAGGAADICGATDEPLGPCHDSPAIGERATISHLGASPGTKTMVASKAIGDGDRVFTTAGGKVTDTAINNSWLVGKAITAASGDGKTLTVVPCFPRQQTV